MILLPFGLNNCIIAALDSRISPGRVCRGCWRFFGSAVVKIVWLILFPAPVTWRPGTM